MAAPLARQPRRAASRAESLAFARRSGAAVPEPARSDRGRVAVAVGHTERASDLRVRTGTTADRHYPRGGAAGGVVDHGRARRSQPGRGGAPRALSERRLSSEFAWD